MVLRRAAYVAEAQRLRNPFIAPLQETPEQISSLLTDPHWRLLLAVLTQDNDVGRRGRFVGSIRIQFRDDLADIGRVVVAPDVRGRGIGSALLEAAHREALSHASVQRCEICVGDAAVTDLALYRRNGYTHARPRTGEGGRSVPVLTLKLDRR
ncbi:MAG: GNAT family N-acetyltransferase [Micrococcales bacterium]|nr:MAG: GNAT family N-acetyltransferase [Micrococcales bacterium]